MKSYNIIHSSKSPPSRGYRAVLGPPVVHEVAALYTLVLMPQRRFLHDELGVRLPQLSDRM
jgi:hypothetical protein